VTLLEIQAEWNRLVPEAQALGIRVRPWAVPPHNRDYGLHRLATLRSRMSLPTDHINAPVMERGHLSHVQIQAAWNALVPAAQARGIRATHWTNPAPSRIRGMRRLNWLQAQLARLGDSAASISTTMVDSVLVTSIAPNLAEFTFGVELECFLPVGKTRLQLAQAIRASACVPCSEESYHHQARANWRVTTDGSLGDYVRGCEIVSPVLRGDDGFAQLEKVCQAVTIFGCTVRKNCGLHVHIGARNQPVSFFKNLAKLYVHYEEVIDSVLSPSRRGSENHYCQPNRFSALDLERAQDTGQVLRVLTATTSDRYRKLNFASFWRHGTVEFRHHQGTVEPVKVSNWVKFCLRMSSAAKTAGDTALASKSLDGLLEVLQSGEDEKEYFQKRRNEFAGPNQR
jgi:hypothetical protein